MTLQELTQKGRALIELEKYSGLDINYIGTELLQIYNQHSSEELFEIVDIVHLLIKRLDYGFKSSDDFVTSHYSTGYLAAESLMELLLYPNEKYNPYQPSEFLLDKLVFLNFVQFERFGTQKIAKNTIAVVNLLKNVTLKPDDFPSEYIYKLLTNQYFKDYYKEFRDTSIEKEIIRLHKEYLSLDELTISNIDLDKTLINALENL